MHPPWQLYRERGFKISDKIYMALDGYNNFTILNDGVAHLLTL